MQKKLLFSLIFFLMFFSKITSSSCNLDNSLDCCLFTTTTILTHNCGYSLHKKFIFNFNQEDPFDRTCARTTGIIGTTFLFNLLSGGICSPDILYTPIIAHNVLKVVDTNLNKSISSEFYKDSQKSNMKKIN